MTNLKKKIRENNGESLGETLVALLIMCMAVIIITGGIVTSARINHRAAETKTASGLNVTTESGKLVTDTTATVTVTCGTDKKNVDVTLYTDTSNTNKRDYFKFYELR